MINHYRGLAALLVWSSVGLAEPLSWEQVEQQALDTRGRVQSAFEIAQYGSIAQMRELLELQPEALHVRDAHGRSLLDLARLGGERSMELYLQRLSHSDSDTPNVSIGSGSQSSGSLRTPAARQAAMKAAREDDTAALRRLIAAGFDVNCYSMIDKATPVEEAVRAGSLDALRLLVGAGADWRIRSQREDHSKPMLLVAATHNRPDIITYLLSLGADPMEKGANGATALHDACYYLSLDAIRVLLPSHKEQNYSPDGGVNSYPLRLAIDYRPNEVAQVIDMFAAAGFDPNHAMFADEPLLIHASKKGNKAAASALLRAGADPTVRDNQGKTAADYASLEMRVLLEQYKGDF